MAPSGCVMLCVVCVPACFRSVMLCVVAVVSLLSDCVLSNVTSPYGVLKLSKCDVVCGGRGVIAV